MIIVGAGMAGLLAAHMLRRHEPRVIEAQSSLPNNHAALLRFRSRKVSEATGIPFTEVRVRKGIVRWRTRGYERTFSETATLADNNEYSQKVTGEVMDRSVLNLETSTRYIAPSSFIADLARGQEIEYNTPLAHIEWDKKNPQTIISTVPMPVLMNTVGWERVPVFKWSPIWTTTVSLLHPAVNVYQTLYYPEHNLNHYRASLTGSRLTIECMRDPNDGPPGRQNPEWIYAILSDFGIRNPDYSTEITVRQEYGKLLPTDEAERKSFIMGMTDEFNLWSLGRFATWRQLLLDDVVDDVRFIDRILATRDNYARRLHHHTS